MTGKRPKKKNPSLKKYRKALVFGAFNPLHYGHIRLFKRVSLIADKVYACTESNQILKKEKGCKAFTSEKERMQDLLGIKYLSGVYCRTEKKNRDHVVKILKPDVLVLGSDWQGKYWAGEALGVPIVYLPRTDGISSTMLRECIQELI